MQSSHRTLVKYLKLVFERKPKGSERKDIRSFVKTLKLIKKYKDPKRFDSIFFRFVNLLWKPNSQGIERNNPNADKDIKMAAYNEFIKTIPEMKKHNTEVQKMIEEYYKKYKMT